jgi:serine/threonine protein phosphatase PrpC
MSSRLATRIGLPARDERAADAHDLVRFRQPTMGAEVRSKGSLFLLAQVTGGDAALARAAAEALEAIERDYYYDLSAGTTGSIAKALSAANRLVFHQRARLGMVKRGGGISVVALVVRGRDGHVAKLGPAAAVIVREGRLFELPPPPSVEEEDPGARARRVADSLGEALEIQPLTWEGELSPDDRLALLSRNVAQVVGTEEVQAALSTLRPTAAVEHMHQLFQIRGGAGSDGMLAIELVELAATTATHHLEPVRPHEELAGLPDRSPVPLADAIGHFLHRCGDAIDALQAAAGRGLLVGVNMLLAFVPRRHAHYPTTIPRTAIREESRRRRRGLVGIAAVAALLAVGASVASLPNARPTDAILRASAARGAINDALGLLGTVEERVDGRDLVDRDPARAQRLLEDSLNAVGHASDAGVPEAGLEPLRARIDRGLDTVFAAARLGDASTVADLAADFTGADPTDMVLASDGSLWVIELGRGRLIRIDPTTNEATVPYRSGQKLDGATAGAPWMIATAATDMVLIDRARQAWRFDLVEQKAHRLGLQGLGAIGPDSSLLAALQHRPPLEIFNLYLVDTGSDQVLKWSPGDVIPVRYPDPPEPFLVERPDPPAAAARDLFVDANLWLLQAGTVTRVNFGTPLNQANYSLDPPPDASLRPTLDYRLLDGATIGEREMFYVYDAANARILAYQRADGAFVSQWLAPRNGATAGLLDHVLALSVASVADGPPVAYLLTPTRVVRVVLE